MAQNITLMGASYTAVPAVQLPKTGGGTARFDDASVTTAIASDVASGKIFLLADGTIATGTNSGGGGASAWTKIYENTYSVSTTSTSAGTVATISTGVSDLWTSAKWVYVRVRDTVGKRNDYFYGTDNFICNLNPVNGTTATTTTAVIRNLIRYSNDQFAITHYTGTSAYGVYADTVYSDGRVRIRRKYNASISLTINSTYKVEIYLLDTPDGVPIFQ